MNKAIIIGGVHHNTLGVIRSLGLEGIKPYVILVTSEKHPYVKYSNYIEECFVVNSEEKVLKVLLDKFSSEENKPIVIACADSIESLLDKNYNQLSVKFVLPGSRIQGRVNTYMNKEKMERLAQEIGFVVPDSYVVDTEKSDVVPLPFPWITKPLASKDGSKSDIKRIFNEEEWHSYICGEHCKHLQIQKLIDKDFEYQLIGCSLDEGAEIIIPGVSYVIRPSSTSNTGFLKYISLSNTTIVQENLIKLCKKFICKVGYSGLFSIEFLKGKDGKDYFMEMNFRNDGNSICVTMAGCNLPYIWYVHGIGGKYQINSIEVNQIYVNPEIQNFHLLLARQISLKEWFRDLKKTNVFMEWSKLDKVPALVLYGQYFSHLLKKIFFRSTKNK